MRRRDFFGLVGAVTAWSAVARAQQPVPARRIGFLTGLAENDPATRARLGAFRSGLAALGWIEGRNLHLDTRFAPGVSGASEALIAELRALGPDLLLVQGPGVSAATAATKPCPLSLSLGSIRSAPAGSET